MIILPLSIVLNYYLTKTFDLTFIKCHNILLQSFSMVMTMLVCATSRVPYHIHHINSDVRRHFLICGYGVFLYLRCAMSYLKTMYTYYLCISCPFSFVSTLWRKFFAPFSFVSMLYPVLSPSVSTLDSIFTPPVSMLDSISSRFDLILTTFITHP